MTERARFWKVQLTHSAYLLICTFFTVNHAKIMRTWLWRRLVLSAGNLNAVCINQAAGNAAFSDTLKRYQGRNSLLPLFKVHVRQIHPHCGGLSVRHKAITHMPAHTEKQRIEFTTPKHWRQTPCNKKYEQERQHLNIIHQFFYDDSINRTCNEKSTKDKVA